ncbi:MAG: cyclic nucleotide-binding domain-containing protein [Leptolyngbyaceae cyanobacterium RU_5_1]|nr:cyclic nucleotide-binding domain-containing protein [Leptolyngbyaceae cyanobacterium RU_5_1]
MKTGLFLLGELDDDDIDWMVATGSRQEILAETVLIQEGDPTDYLYVLLEGVLSVSTAATQGREIAELSSGDVIGEMSFVDTRPPSATVIAKQNSLVLAISREHLGTKLRLDGAFAARFYRALAISLSNRLRFTVGQLETSGRVQRLDSEGSVNDLDRDSQENMVLAKTRLDWLLRRLKDE